MLALCSTSAWAQPTTNTATISTAEVDTIIDTPVTQQVNAYSTQLIAEMEGGPVLYDQTFPVPFADPVFQSAIGSAESVLTDRRGIIPWPDSDKQYQYFEQHDPDRTDWLDF